MTAGSQKDAAGGGTVGGQGGTPSPVADFSDLAVFEAPQWRRWWRRWVLRRPRFTIEAEPVVDGPAVTLYATDDVTEALTEWTRLGHLMRKGTLSPMFSLLLLTVDGRVARHEIAPVKATARAMRKRATE